MTNSARATPVPTPRRVLPDGRWSVAPAPVAAWAAAQVACCAVAWLQVPLAAAYRPGELLGLELLVGGQVAAAAALCGPLLRSPGTAAVVVASVWPALLLAAGLAARPPADALRAGAAVTAWLLALVAWSAAARGRRWEPVVAAAATLVAVGGVGLSYLATEFGPPLADGSPADRLASTPMRLAWAAADGSAAARDAVPLAVGLSVGVALSVVRQVRRRRERAASRATSSPPPSATSKDSA